MSSIGAVIVMEDGETATVITRPIDIMLWENGAKKKITDGMGMGDMMRVVFTAAKRDDVCGAGAGSFDSWAEKVVSFDPLAPDAEGDATGPTQTGPSTG